MYKCCKCGRSINIGDKYFDLNGDKPWETVEVCPVCVKELDKDTLIERPHLQHLYISASLILESS